MSRRGEFDLIAEVFAPLAGGDPMAFGLGDDAAVVRPAADEDLVVTTDALVRGVHFPAGSDPGRVGRKLLRVNLSDLAAKGARPVAYLLTAALPDDVDDGWIEAFAAGLAEDQERFGVHLIGGDTTSSPELVLSATLFGTVPRGAMVLRGGARAGDVVFVSGTIGDAGLGLAAARGALPGLDGDTARALRDRFELPEPRLRLGAALRGIATAAADISDGLLADLGHICAQSGVGAEVRLYEVPASEAARAALALAPAPERDPARLTAGGDYELVFTAPVAARERIGATGEAAGVPVAPVGTIAAGGGVRLVDANGTAIAVESAGYRHF